jgi:inorganic phosphate transporter, PiT family
MPSQLTIVIILALIFDFLNAVHGSSNIVATMISSRAFRPLNALLLAGIAEFIGPFLYGVAVARTIGAEIIDVNIITLRILMACMIASILWSLLTWFLGLPSSTSHGLVGGLVGATIVGAGINAIRLPGLIKTLVGLFGTPVIGFGLGFLLLRLILFLAWNASPRINEFFKRSQLLTSVVLASSHSSNDAQKAMGIIVLGMLISGSLSSFAVPAWVVAATAMGMMLGTLFGGFRLIRTLGGKFYKIRPLDSFTAQTASVLVILGSSVIGWPVSTTQVVSSAILGVGSSERFGKVRWSVAGGIVLAWVVTVPVTAALAAGVYWVLIRLLP